MPGSKIKQGIRLLTKRIALKLMPELSYVFNAANGYLKNSSIDKSALLYPPYAIEGVKVGAYTYISNNAVINRTTIGKFCSIGPNFFCGWGLHPIHGLSTHPMFYSSRKQNGQTLSATDKVEETLPVNIGNDVFIGANVTVLDGISIGNGAVIGAGTIVSKDIPAYAVAVGSPVRILKYRLTEYQFKRLEKIEWWNFDEQQLMSVEQNFFDVDRFIASCETLHRNNIGR